MSVSSTTGPTDVTSSVLFSNTTDIPLYPAVDTGLSTTEAVIRFLHKYYIWIVFAVGFPGNLISLFVVVRMSRYQLSTMLFYVGLLAVVDNIAIIMKILKNQDTYGNLSVDILQCKFMNFFGYTFVAYANWILVVMSVDRLAAVVFPLKVKLFMSLKRAVKIVSIVFICLCTIHSHFFITMTRTSRSKCQIHTDYSWFYRPWWFISSSVYAIVPAIVISFINISIIAILKRSASRGGILRSETDPLNVELRRRQRQERRVTTTLVTVAVVFVILTLPRCIFVIWFDYWGSGRGHAGVITTNIADSNHAVNFYLYFWRGRRFRHYFLDLLPSDISKALERCSKTTETTETASRRTGTGL